MSTADTQRPRTCLLDLCCGRFATFPRGIQLKKTQFEFVS
jgi:hypothetical protein